MTESSRTPTDTTDATQWQARYQKLRREYESFEAESRERFRQYGDIIDSLQSSQGFGDDSASATLNALLSAAKAEKPVAQLSVQVEAFRNKLQQQAESRGEKNRQAASQLLALLERLQSQLDSDPQLEGDPARIKKLKRELERLNRRGIDHQFDIQPWFEQFAAVHPQRNAADAGPVKRSWFDRFRRTGSPDQAIADPGDPEATQRNQPDPGREVDGSEPDSNVVDVAAAGNKDGQPARRPSAPLAAVPEPLATGEVAAILLGLLADIEVPEDGRELARTLYTRLEQGITPADLVPVLDDSVRVVSLALHRDQSDFQLFLQGLDDRLVFLNDFLNELNRHLTDAGDDSTQLERGVSQQLQEISSSVADSSSIEQLKERVSSSVEQASGLLEQFAQTQRQRQQAVESRTQDLQLQVTELEQQAEHSRQSLAKQREKLLRDRLTGLPNREAYENRLQDEYARWRRYQRPLAFVIADIDHFKQINDQFGHAAGDKVLALVAKLMREKLRDSDFIARYGGEEFAIVLPETTVEAASIAIEKLRAAVAESPFNFRQTPVSVTCSFGITGFHGEDTLETVFERADQALYRAKESGRNQFQTG